MAAIKDEIDKVIQPYKASEDEKPPFTGAELAVMATLHNGVSTTASQMLRWVLKNFSYYREKALDTYAIIADTKNDYFYLETRVGCVVEGFFKAFDRYEIPLESDDLKGGKERGYTVPVPEGRLYLAHLLQPERKGAFPFLKLPAELRNTIYELLFTFPEYNLFPCGYYRTRRQITLERKRVLDTASAKGPISAAGFYTASGERITAPPSSKLLALLRVCRQVYQEAMPYFFRDNEFHFRDAEALEVAMTRLSRRRIEQLAHVNVKILAYPSASIEGFPDGMKRLALVKSLKKLVIDVGSDDWWLKMKRYNRKAFCHTDTKPFKKFEQIPGFADLAVAASKAEELVIEGECPKVKEWLAQEVKKIKNPEDEVAAPKKKRKSKAAPKVQEEDEDGEEVAEPPKKRARRGKKAAS